MLHQQSLDFRWGDAEAFVLDHLFLAIDDVGMALGVDESDVAGVEPAITQRSRVLFWRFPVTLHNLRSADDDLTVLAHWHFALAGFEIHDLLLRVVYRQAHTVGMDQALIFRLRVRERGGF